MNYYSDSVWCPSDDINFGFLRGLVNYLLFEGCRNISKSALGCSPTLSWCVIDLPWMTSLTYRTLKSVCKVCFDTHQRVSAIVRRIYNCHLCIMIVCDSLVHPQSSFHTYTWV